MSETTILIPEPVASPAASPRPARRRIEAVALSLVGGLVLYVATRYEALGPLVAAGWVLLLLPSFGDRWRAPLLGFIPGQMAWIVAAHLALTRMGWFVPFVLPPILTWNYFVLALLVYALRRVTRAPAVLILPPAIAAAEWLRAIIGVGNYNMYQVGTFLAPYPILVQFADVIGAYGLTVLWTIPFAFVVDLAGWVAAGRPAPGRPTVRRGAIATAAVMLVLPLYGVWRMSAITVTPGPRISIIQPSLEHTREQASEVVRRQVQQTVSGVEPGSTDLVVWPENAVFAVYERSPDYQAAVRVVAKGRGAPLLFGAQGIAPDGKRPTNTAFLVDGEGQVRGRYDKIVLFPFTERRAFRSIEAHWPWLEKTLTAVTQAAWNEAPDGWSPDDVTLLAVPGFESLPFWTPICYESSYPDLARRAARSGARFFVNLTSEGWLGWGVSNNMMNVNILRAVENRVGLVRAGNTGPSAFVLPDGRVQQFLRGTKGRLRLDTGQLTARIAAGSGSPTAYARIGGVLDPAWFIACCVWLAAAAWRRRRGTGPVGEP